MKSKYSIVNHHHSDDEHYRTIATSYDEQIPSFLPGSGVFFETCLSYLPEHAGTLLELGSGTGYATSHIRKKNPEIMITCLDHAPEMLAAAKTKPELDGVLLIQQDIREPWPGDRYDCIFSTLCLHHIPHTDRQTLFHMVREALRPGGVFICGDIIRPETRRQEEIYREHWKRSMKQAEMSPEAIDQIIASREHNYADMETIHSFAERLTKTGFDPVLMPYRYGISAVFIAYT